MDKTAPLDWTSEPTSPPSRVADDWPLIGDIVSHRMEIPTLLLLWQAQKDQDPKS